VLDHRTKQHSGGRDGILRKEIDDCNTR